MRLLLITTMLGLVAGTASASSIEAIVSGTTNNASVVTLGCDECPPLQTKKKATYVVPTIGKGTETIELKEINGEMKLVRTEAWLGGSPVVFVSKPPEAMIKAAAKAEEPAEPTAALPEIDQTAKTSAVASMTGFTADSRQFDPSALQLRLN